MDFLSPSKHRNSVINSNSSEQGRAPLEPGRRRGSFLDVPGQQLERTAWGSGNNERKPTKLLLNVNLQNSLGPVQVVMSPENSVMDLIRAVVDIYVRGKRRPLLKTSDPRHFKLHYSQFSLEGLKPEEKLKNLGSRNFFLCQESSKAMKWSCSDQAKAESPFPLTMLMDFLL